MLTRQNNQPIATKSRDWKLQLEFVLTLLIVKKHSNLRAKLSNTLKAIWLFYPTSKALQSSSAKTVRQDRECKIYMKIYEINTQLWHNHDY